METTSPGRSEFAQKAAVLIATSGALALLAVVLAYWTWGWFAPRVLPRTQDALHASGRAMPADTLFGKGRSDAKPLAAGESSFKLLGVVAAAGARSGYALMRLDSGETAVVREGAAVAPGIRLKEVHADHVLIERKGSLETLAWPEKPAKPEPAAPRMLK